MACCRNYERTRGPQPRALRSTVPLQAVLTILWTKNILHELSNAIASAQSQCMFLDLLLDSIPEVYLVLKIYQS